MDARVFIAEVGSYAEGAIAAALEGAPARWRNRHGFAEVQVRGRARRRAGGVEVGARAP